MKEIVIETLDIFMSSEIKNKRNWQDDCLIVYLRNGTKAKISTTLFE